MFDLLDTTAVFTSAHCQVGVFQFAGLASLGGLHIMGRSMLPPPLLRHPLHSQGELHVEDTAHPRREGQVAG